MNWPIVLGSALVSTGVTVCGGLVIREVRIARDAIVRELRRITEPAPLLLVPERVTAEQARERWRAP